MENEKKAALKTLLPVFIIAVLTILLAWGFSSGIFNKAISVLRGPVENEETTTINTEVEMQNLLPRDMHGVWLNEGVDFADRSSPAEEVKASIENVISSLDDIYADSIIVSAGDFLKDDELGKDTDSLKYVFEKARAKNIYAVLHIPASCLMNDVQKLETDNQKLINLLQAYSPNAVLFDGFESINFENPSEETTAFLTDKVKELNTIVKTVKPDTLVGFSVLPVWANKSDNELGLETNSKQESLKKYHADTKSWAEKEFLDFIYIKSDITTADEDVSLDTVVNWWNEVLKKTQTYAILGIKPLNAAKDELVKQIDVLSHLQSFSGFAFDSYKSFSENTEAKKEYINYMQSSIQGNLEVGSLEISRPNNKKTVTNESSISFMGTADIKAPLYCNGSEIPRSSLGLFSISLQLKAGENEFTFTHNGTSLTYTVVYELDILTDVYPTGKTETLGGMLVQLSALCYKDAKVYAMVGNTKVELQASGQNSLGQSAAPSDFVSFVGAYAMPISSKKVDLGKVMFYATYNGIQRSMQGGEISVLPKLDSSNISNIIMPPTNIISLYSQKKLPLKTPYSDHGLGKALMCEVLKDYAETTPADSLDDKSSPLYRPLIKGTFDYVKSIATFDDEMHFMLASGRKIYAKDAKIISEGYKMPENSLNVRSVKSSKGETEIIIKTDWLVPVSALISPQEYYAGYQSRVFNVNQFTGEYLDIVFYNTNNAGGRLNVLFNNAIKSAKWINIGANGNTTLRLQLHNKGQFYGYSIGLTDDGNFKIIIKNRDTNIKKKVIMLDPGHGGDDPGAIGVYSSIYESHLNLLIAKKVKAELENMGAKVLMTRSSDSSLTLNERMLMARTHRPDAFVSIHHDASTSSVNSGTHSFYYHSYSMPLARSIHTRLVNAYAHEGVIPTGAAEYSSIDLKYKFYPFAVTRVEECPSVLVECGYLTNAVNANGLLNPQSQDSIARAIANGIADYFANY